MGKKYVSTEYKVGVIRNLYHLSIRAAWYLEDNWLVVNVYKKDITLSPTLIHVFVIYSVCMTRIENMLCLAERSEWEHEPSKNYHECE